MIGHPLGLGLGLGLAVLPLCEEPLEALGPVLRAYHVQQREARHMGIPPRTWGLPPLSPWPAVEEPAGVLVGFPEGIPSVVLARGHLLDVALLPEVCHRLMGQ